MDAAVINGDSILTSTKKLLGIESTYNSFDTDIIIHINTVLSSLVQMGVGPSTGFAIEGVSEKWSDFIGSTSVLTQQVKSYVYIKVKMLFDPPANGNLLDALKENAKEMEFRLFVQTDPIPVVEVVE